MKLMAQSSTNFQIRKVYGAARKSPMCDRFRCYKTESPLTSILGFASRYYFTLMPSQRYCYCERLSRTNSDIGSSLLASIKGNCTEKIKAVGFSGQRKKTVFWYTFFGGLERVLESQPSSKKLFVFWDATDPFDRLF